MRQDTGKSLDKIWTGAVTNHKKLRVAQTLGFTTYVLDHKLQNIKKYTHGH